MVVCWLLNYIWSKLVKRLCEVSSAIGTSRCLLTRASTFKRITSWMFLLNLSLTPVYQFRMFLTLIISKYSGWNFSSLDPALHEITNRVSIWCAKTVSKHPLIVWINLKLKEKIEFNHRDFPVKTSLLEVGDTGACPSWSRGQTTVWFWPMDILLVYTQGYIITFILPLLCFLFCFLLHFLFCWLPRSLCKLVSVGPYELALH